MIIDPDLLLMFITRLEKNTKPFKMVYFISKHLSFLADFLYKLNNGFIYSQILSAYLPSAACSREAGSGLTSFLV